MQTSRLRQAFFASALFAAIPLATVSAQEGLAREPSRVTTSRPQSARALHVSLVPTIPSVLPIGEPIGFRLRSSTRGFAHLYVLSASGKVQLWFENLPVGKMRWVSYPTPGLQVRAAPPAGDETIVFLVTRDRFKGFAGRGTSQSPLALQHTHASFTAALASKTSTLEPGRFASARSTIRVTEQSRSIEP